MGRDRATLGVLAQAPTAPPVAMAGIWQPSRYTDIESTIPWVIDLDMVLHSNSILDTLISSRTYKWLAIQSQLLVQHQLTEFINHLHYRTWACKLVKLTRYLCHDRGSESTAEAPFSITRLCLPCWNTSERSLLAFILTLVPVLVWGRLGWILNSCGRVGERTIHVLAHHHNKQRIGILPRRKFLGEYTVHSKYVHETRQPALRDDYLIAIKR